MSLTNAQLKSVLNKPHDKTHVDYTDGQGLLARHFRSGSISWYLRYRWLGKQVILKLGAYPDMSIKDARRERDKCKDLLEVGKDPRFEKRSEILHNQGRATVEDALNYWYENYCAKKRTGHESIRALFYNHVIPDLGKVAAENVSVQDWIRVFQKIEHKPGAVAYTLANLKQAFKYCRMTDFCHVSTLENLTAPMLSVRQNVEIKRVLSQQELREVYLDCLDHRSRSTIVSRYSAIILMVTGARSGELRLSHKDHFDFDKMIWTVPPENSKCGNEIKRPIPERLVPFIVEMINLSPANGMLVSKRNRTEYVAQSVYTKRFEKICKRLGHKKWSAHNFRHTISTTFGDLGIAPHVAEKMLGHSMGGILAIYNKSHYLNEQLEAMNTWFDYITGEGHEHSTSNNAA